MKKFFIGFLVFVSFLEPVHSEDWDLLEDTPHKKVYIDSDSKIEDKQQVKIKEVTQSNEIITLVEMKCPERKIRELYKMTYSLDGNLQSSNVVYSDWINIKSYSSGKWIESNLCDPIWVNHSVTSSDKEGFHEYISIVGEDLFLSSLKNDLRDQIISVHREYINNLKDIDENLKKIPDYLLNEIIRRETRVENAFFTKNKEKYIYMKDELDLLNSSFKMYGVSILGFKGNDFVEIRCSSLKPIDITKNGQCSDEIQERLGIKLEKNDLPALNLQ